MHSAQNYCYYAVCMLLRVKTHNYAICSVVSCSGVWAPLPNSTTCSVIVYVYTTTCVPFVTRQPTLAARERTTAWQPVTESIGMGWCVQRACMDASSTHLFFVSQNTAYDNLVFLAPFFNLSARPKPGDFTSYSCDKPLSLAPGSSLLPSFLSSRHRLRRRVMNVKKKRGAVLLV